MSTDSQPHDSTSKPARSALGLVVLIVLIDLLGFSLVMPLLGFFGDRFKLDGWQVGLLFAAFPICQLVAGPILGRLSDRYGRRPVLVFSQAGTAVSFVIMGLAGDFTTLLLGRMLDGFSGGNILVAQAYIADVTRPEDRARGMGMIGMAFGLGFVLGPLIGGLLVGLPVSPEWALSIPFLAAAGFSTLALLLVILRLPESLPRGARPRDKARVASWRGLLDVFRLEGVGTLATLAFLSVAAWAVLEGTFALFLERRMGWSSRSASYAFAAAGLVSAIVQGGMIRPLTKRYAEIRLVMAGAVLAGIGFAIAASLSGASAVPLAAAIVLAAAGSGLTAPCISGLVSRITPASEQGAVFGTLVSIQTLARIVSYMLGNVLLARVSPSAPYWLAAAVYAVVLALGAAKAGRLADAVRRSGETAGA